MEEKKSEANVENRDFSLEREKAWDNYMKHMSGKPPRGLIKKFTQYLQENDKRGPETHIVDIGCGPGNDALFYGIKQGFKVTALDYIPSAIQTVKEQSQNYPNIQTKISNIIKEPIPVCDVASASHCMQFIPPDKFDDVWNNNIVPSIRPGGYFVGHFLGEKDEWAASYSSDMTFLTKAQIESLFDAQKSCFEGVKFFKEKEKDISVPKGTKHWHIFTIFAQKKKDNPKQNPMAQESNNLDNNKDFSSKLKL